MTDHTPRPPGLSTKDLFAPQRLARFFSPGTSTPADDWLFRPLPLRHFLKQLMQGYYLLTKAAPTLGLKTAWVTSGAPVEVPLAMGIIPQFPENFGALCGARKVSVDLCQSAEAKGYSPDLCSYARNSLGSLFDPTKAPFKGLSRPDVLIACNNICGTVTKWWEHMAHYLKVPLFLLDTPFTEGPRPPHLIDYASRQVEELIVFLEQHTGRRYREPRLRKVAARSNEAVALWNQCLALCANRPSPLDSVDRFFAMAPVVTLRGTRWALAFYRAFKKEIDKRVARGEGAIRHERRRLLWDNIAIWYRLYGFFKPFARAGVAFPVDTYTSIWSGAMGDDDTPPARRVAKVYSEIYLNRDMQHKIDTMAQMIEDFSLDGFVLHSNRSCKPYSLGQHVIHQQLSQRTGKPGLIIEADMVDARLFDRKRVDSQIATFLEML